jgi:hypothetical protein
MILKPRIDLFVAMLLGGAVIAFIGFGSAIAIGLWAGLVPAAVGGLGLFWIAIGIAGLRTRPRFAIKIDGSGITLPTGNVFRVRDPVHIPVQMIATISRDESISGRFIAIALRTGGTVPIQARHYCALKTFLRHCRSYGLPTSEVKRVESLNR